MRVKFDDELLSHYRNIDLDAPDIVNKTYEILKNHETEYNRNIPQQDLEEEYKDLTQYLPKISSEIDASLELFHETMRKHGATETQISWEIYNNIKLNRAMRKKIAELLELIINESDIFLLKLGLRKYIEDRLHIEHTDWFNYNRRPEKYNTSNLRKVLIEMK